jgi:thiol:disulfide interchange protein
VSSNLNFLFALLVVILIVTFALASRSCGTPRIPGFIDPLVKLEEAEARSSQSGKPVFALVAADWCAACTSLKAGALADSDVAEYIKANFEPVYVDVSASNRQDADALAMMSRLGVRALPAMVVLRRGVRMGAVEGAVPAKETLDWLKKAAAPPS